MFKLMAAHVITDEHLDKLRYPILVTPKMNGIRVVKYRGALYTRQGLKVENRFLQARYASIPDGFEGELIAGFTFSETSGIVRSVEAVPVEYSLVLFDNLSAFDKPYASRMEDINEYVYSFFHCVNVSFCISTECFRAEQVRELYENALKQPYPSGEGLILRDPHAFYKEGRSTITEQALLKMKRSTTAIAEVMSKTALVQNGKEQSAVGSFSCSSKDFARPFKLGSGFTHEERVHLWRACGVGDRIEFEYFEKSNLGAPLHPRFKSVVNPSITK